MSMLLVWMWTVAVDLPRRLCAARPTSAAWAAAVTTWLAVYVSGGGPLW